VLGRQRREVAARGHALDDPPRDVARVDCDRRLDPATLGGAVVLCVVVVLAGSFVPVSRVMKIESSDALRSE
jgi:hypothetical protein